MCDETDAEEFRKERKSLMDSMGINVMRSGFSAVNENLTDIAKALDKRRGMLADGRIRWMPWSGI